MKVAIGIVLVLSAACAALATEARPVTRIYAGEVQLLAALTGPS